MSKEITAQLLKKKVDSIKNPNDRKTYLINCLRRQGLIKEESKSKELLEPNYDLCKLCNSSNFIFTSNEKVCQQCGTSETSLDANPYKTYKADINLKKGTFIEPGTMTVTINKDGKMVKRDLSKINTWLSSDPDEQKIKLSLAKITEILDILSTDYNPIVFDRIKNECLSMWYNIISVRPNLRGNERLSLIVWCIYYPITYNGLSINIQKLATIVGVPIGDIFSYNFVMKDIFSNTPYENYILVPTGITAEIQLPSDIERKLRIVKRDLKDYLSSPIKDKEYYAIIYYLGTITKNKTLTLLFLSEKSGISQTTIGNEANKIMRFYNSNPKLKRAIS
tara:strand:+ start:5671 stop:6678 length:1008 start_codon:yes stop_codon:yes gene_type:complete